MNLRTWTRLALLAPLALSACHSTAQPAPAHPPAASAKLESYSCGAIEHLHTCDGIFLASQPSADDFHKIKNGGVKTVINLRPPSENKDFDEAQLIGGMGLAYVNIPFGKPEQLTDEVFAKARGELGKAQKPILMHCHSANRVGAIWLAYRVLDDGLAYDAALAEAKTVGLTSPALEAKAKDYIQRQHQESP
ncbi:MAG: protein tyrosine phosphatase family protein [Planctomycetes bacterium]|nr:protein tyrosine phosphatase family protein [Planctomycetota bacterium]